MQQLRASLLLLREFQRLTGGPCTLQAQLVEEGSAARQQKHDRKILRSNAYISQVPPTNAPPSSLTVTLGKWACCSRRDCPLYYIHASMASRLAPGSLPAPASASTVRLAVADMRKTRSWKGRNSFTSPTTFAKNPLFEFRQLIFLA